MFFVFLFNHLLSVFELLALAQIFFSVKSFGSWVRIGIGLAFFQIVRALMNRLFHDVVGKLKDCSLVYHRFSLLEVANQVVTSSLQGMSSSSM